MLDLTERLHDLDLLEVPDLLARAGAMRSVPERPEPERSPRRRVAAALVAAALFVGIVALALPLARMEDPSSVSGVGEVVVKVDERLMAIQPDGSGSRVIVGFPFLGEGCDERVNRMNLSGPTASLTYGCYVGDSYSWSPDGTRFAFTAAGVSSANGQKHWAIYVVGAEGGDSVLAAECPGGGARIDHCSNLTWSPDGTRIAYSVEQELRVTTLASGRTIAIARCELCDDRRGAAADLSWSPDSTRIAFRRSAARDAVLAVVNADGTGFDLLVDPIDDAPSVAGPLAWLPDGTQVLYRTHRSNDHRHEGIWSVDVATGERTEIIDIGRDATLAGVSLTPDGRTVVYATTVSLGCTYPADCPIQGVISTTGVDGSDPATIYSECCVSWGARDAFTGPALSRNGLSLAFTVTFDGGRPGESGLYVMDLDGSDLQRIADAGIDPRW